VHHDDDVQGSGGAGDGQHRGAGDAEGRVQADQGGDVSARGGQCAPGEAAGHQRLQEAENEAQVRAEGDDAYPDGDSQGRDEEGAGAPGG